MNSFSFQWIRKFFRGTIPVSLVISLSIFVWLRLIFFEVPFSLQEDAITLVKVVVTGWLMVVGIKGIFYALLGICELVESRSFKPLFEKKWVALFIAAIALSAVLVSCDAQLSTGIKKDLSTGLTTSYNGLVPGETRLVMNEEVLNHTDIPIGESFFIVNENVEGLKVKDGNISVGCSLIITDKNGKKMLEAADLFSGKDVLPKENGRFLKCIVNTGKPMEWEENYKVVATFWDKYGSGKIVNTVTIRAIDMP